MQLRSMYNTRSRARGSDLNKILQNFLINSHWYAGRRCRHIHDDIHLIKRCMFSLTLFQITQHIRRRRTDIRVGIDSTIIGRC